MRKQLLAGFVLMGSLFTANAQYSSSFEVSEGYTLGDINGQNAWYTTQIVDENNEPLFMIENQVVTNAAGSFSDGANGLLLTFESEVGQANTPIVGAFRPVTVNGTGTVAFDVYIDQKSQQTSDFAFQMTDEAGNIAAYVQFRFNGNVSSLVEDIDPETGEPALFFSAFEGITWNAQTWYRVAAEVDTAAGVVTYYIDGNEVGTSEMFTDEPIATMSFGLDNYGGFAYVDNISDDATAGVNEYAIAGLSVFPNPATSVINIANSENALVEAVSITDINGRIVKNVKFNSVSEAEINVSDLSSGIYMMSIASDKGSVTKKIVKN